MARKFFVCDQNTIDRVGHYLEYTHCVAEAVHGRGLTSQIFCNKRLPLEEWVTRGKPFYAVFSNTWAEEDKAGLYEGGLGTVVPETLTALASFGATPEDHVLFHTVGLVEFRYWLRYFVDLPLSRLIQLPQFHFILRFDPARLEADASHEWSRLIDQVKGRADILKSYVHFCSDTIFLANRYSALLGFRVSLAPIPFGQDALRRAQSEKAVPPCLPICVLYLGDARPEKGFDHIPTLILTLWKSHVESRKIRFVIQSNLNVPGGQGRTIQNINELRRYPSAMVELIDAPMAPDDYYRRLVECDVVLVAYSAESYRSRSSGVLVEALAAGKPVITTAGSWMATQVSRAHAQIVNSPDDLASALLDLVERLPQAREVAQKIAPTWLSLSSPDFFVESLLKFATPLSTLADAPCVLFVANGEAVANRTGESAVTHRQLRYFFGRGFRVLGLFIVAPPSNNLSEQSLSLHQLDRELIDYPFIASHRIFFATPESGNTANPDWHLQTPIRRPRDGSEGQNRETNYSITLLSELKLDRPSVILLNHAINISVLDSLALQGVPIVCETHNDKAGHSLHAGTRGHLVSTDNLHDSLLAQCNYLLTFNESEAARLCNDLPKTPCALTPIGIDDFMADAGNLAGHVDLAALVADCDSDNPTLTEYGAYPPTLEQQVLASFGGRLDLLYVDSHAPNGNTELKWFIEEVFIPRLAPQGVTLIVVGAIKYEIDWPSIANVVWAGTPRNIAPLYAATKVCLSLAGDSPYGVFQTIGAVSYGKPVVGTNQSFRDLPRSLLQFVIAIDDAELLAKRILTLVANPAERHAAFASLTKALETVRLENAYCKVMDDALSGAAAIAPSREASVGFPHRSLPSTMPALVEWTPEVQAANRLIKAWLLPSGNGEQIQSPGAWIGAEQRPAIRKHMIHGILCPNPRGFFARISDEIKAFVKADPDLAFETLLMATGIAPLAIKKTRQRADLQIMLNGAANNSLAVRLCHACPTPLPAPICTMRFGSEALVPVTTVLEDNAIVLSFDLPVSRNLPILQLFNVEFSIDSDTNWQLSNLILKERFSLKTICPPNQEKRYFHEVETSEIGKTFVWTAAPTVKFAIPIWRGVAKNAVLEFLSLQSNKSNELTVSVGNVRVNTKCSLNADGSGLLEFLLPPSRADCAATIKLDVKRVSLASESDSRLIGLAMCGFVVTCDLSDDMEQSAFGAPAQAGPGLNSNSGNIIGNFFVKTLKILSKARK